MSNDIIDYENMLPSERKKRLGGRLYDLMNDTAMRKIFISFWEKFAQEDIKEVFKMEDVISTDQFDIMLCKKDSGFDHSTATSPVKLMGDVLLGILRQIFRTKDVSETDYYIRIPVFEGLPIVVVHGDKPIYYLVDPNNKLGYFIRVSMPETLGKILPLMVSQTILCNYIDPILVVKSNKLYNQYAPEHLYSLLRIIAKADKELIENVKIYPMKDRDTPLRIDLDDKGYHFIIAPIAQNEYDTNESGENFYD